MVINTAVDMLSNPKTYAELPATVPMNRPALSTVKDGIRRSPFDGLGRSHSAKTGGASTIKRKNEKPLIQCPRLSPGHTIRGESLSSHSDVDRETEEQDDRHDGDHLIRIEAVTDHFSWSAAQRISR